MSCESGVFSWLLMNGVSFKNIHNFEESLDGCGMGRVLARMHKALGLIFYTEKKNLLLKCFSSHKYTQLVDSFLFG